MAKVTFKRIESSEDIDDIVVVDGQLIFTKDGKQYLDYENERINVSSGGSGGGGDTLPIGVILPFSGNEVPDNYLLADGSAISRTNYSELFALFGTRYGSGDGETTFNLPDLKGRVPVGYDENDTDFYPLGKTGGEKEHTLTIDEMPSHNHGVLYSGNTLGTASTIVSGTANGTQHNGFILNKGGSEAHNILQPYIAQKYIIKAKMGASLTAQVVDAYSSGTTNAYSTRYINNRLIELIGDLAELTTTDDDNIVDAINELNSQKSSKSNILWTNSNPTNSFASQTITLSSDNYDYLIWIYCYNNNSANTSIHKSSICLKGSSVMMNIIGYSTGELVRRVADYVNDTSYTIRDAYYGSTASSNTYGIPLYIIGGKF